MAMGKNKNPIYESRGVNMDSGKGAGFKASALRRLIGTTPISRGLNSLRHLPLAQVSNPYPISRNGGDGITPLHYGYPAALARNSAPNTSTFEPSPPKLQKKSMDVAGFQNRMAEEDREVVQFFASSRFDEPFIAIDKEQRQENVPPRKGPAISSYESLDCANALNGSTQFPRTLLSDNLNWPDFSDCLRSEKTPPPLPTTTSRSESLHGTGSARGLRPVPRGSYTPYYPIAYGHVRATSSPSWNGQGAQNMVPPALARGSVRSWSNSQNSAPLVPAVLTYGSVGRPYHHGSGTTPGNIPPATRRGKHCSKRST